MGRQHARSGDGAPPPLPDDESDMSTSQLRAPPRNPNYRHVGVQGARGEEPATLHEAAGTMHDATEYEEDPSSGLLSFHVTHRWADPQAVQDAAAVPAAALVNALHGKAGIRGCVALVTCHRSELYLTGPDRDDVRDAVTTYFRTNAYQSAISDSNPGFRPTSPLRQMQGRRSVAHLFRVAAGLDSVIVGEAEVLGQVRAALRTATEQGTIDLPLRHLFEAAIKVGRRVRAETPLGAGRRTLGVTVWDALESYDEVEGPVVVVGAGQAASSIVEAAPTHRRGTLRILNRTMSRGEDLARRTGATALPFADLDRAVQDAKICILAAPVAATRIFGGGWEDAGSADANRLVVDVCQPPTVAGEANPRGFEYWDLAAVLRRGVPGHQPEADGIGDAIALVEESVAAFQRKQAEASSPAGRLLRLLQGQGERIARRELHAALRRLPGLDDRQRAVLEDFARSLRQKLLMTPTIALRRSLETNRLDLAHELLNLFVAVPSADAEDQEASG